MSEQAALYLVSASTGEIVSREPSLAAALMEIERLELAIQDIERERRIQRARVAQLTAELEDKRAAYDRRDEVEDIFKEWAIVCGHPNARLTDDRFDAIRALLEVKRPKPYPREAFNVAIAGAAYDPYVSRRKNGSQKRHDDISLVCRDGQHFEDFCKRAPRPGAT